MLRFKADDGSEFPEWKEHKIAELIQLYNEKVSSDCQLPILTSSKKNGIEYQEDHFVGKQRHDIEGYNILPRNYCTYRNRSDGADFTFNINNLCDKGIVSKFYPVFKENDCDLFFLVSLLNNERKTVREIAYTAKGTGQKVLSITDLRNVIINIPSLSEQQKIAEFLSSLDEVTEKQKETVAVWEERKKGVMQKLFSQEVRFKSDDGSQFPNWEKKKVDELIQLCDEKVSSECELPILTSSKRNGIQYQEDHFAGKQRHDIKGYNVLPRNYCTYRNRSDGTDFTFNINNLCDKGIVSKFYPVFKENNCNLFFLVSLLNNEAKTIRKIAYTAKGTGQKVFSITDLRNITIHIPCLAEQQKIADCLSSLDEVIEKQKATLAAWEELKKGLLQQMFV